MIFLRCRENLEARGINERIGKGSVSGPVYWRSAILLLFVVFCGCGPSVEDIEQMTDQSALAALAKESREYAKIRAALKGLTDQGYLCDVALNATSYVARSEASDKLTDPLCLIKVAREDGGLYSFEERIKPGIREVKEQQALGYVAAEARDNELALGALENLHEETLLAEVALSTVAAAKVRERALGKIQDPAILEPMALNAYDEWIACKAIDKIQDPARLKQIAFSAGREKSQLCAAQGLSAPDDLAEIASTHPLDYVRRSAVKRLEDNSVLREIALRDDDYSVCANAIERITDPDMLAEIALNNPDPRLRRYAIGQVKSLVVLREVAEKDSDSEVREAATERIEQEQDWKSIALLSKDPEKRAEAVYELTDQALLARIAKTDPDARVRSNAMGMLNNDEEKWFLDLVRTAEYQNVRCLAVGHLKDQRTLAELAKTDHDPFIRANALSKVEDPSLAIYAVRHDPDKSVRRAAVEKISDAGLLASVVTADTSPEIRELAAKKLLTLEGFGELDEYHKDIALEMRQAMLDPVLVDRFGNLKMRYRISSYSEDYMKPDTGDYYEWVVERVDVAIVAPDGKVLAKRHFEGEKGEKFETFWEGNQRVNQAVVDISQVLEGLLPKMNRDDLQALLDSNHRTLREAAQKALKH